MAENTRTHYGEISPAVCGVTQESHCQRRSLSVQEHMPTGKA